MILLMNNMDNDTNFNSNDNELMAFKKPDIAPSYMADNPIEQAKRWIVEREAFEEKLKENEILKREKEINQPKVEFHDAYHTADEADIEMEAAAKVIRLGTHEFYKFLRWGKVFYKNENKNLPQERYVKDGSFVTELYTYEVVQRNGNVLKKNGTKVYVTPAGMKRMAKFYNTKYDNFKNETSKK